MLSLSRSIIKENIFQEKGVNMNKRIERYPLVSILLLTLLSFDVTAGVKGKIEVSSGGKMDYSYVDQYPYGRCKIEHIPATDCKQFGYPFGTEEVVKASDVDKYLAEINSGTSHKSMAARIDYGVGGWGLPTSKHLNYAQNAGILINGQTYLYKEGDGTLGFANVGNSVRKFNKNLPVKLLMVTPSAPTADTATGLAIFPDTKEEFKYAVAFKEDLSRDRINGYFLSLCSRTAVGPYPVGSYEAADIKDPGVREYLRAQIDKKALLEKRPGYRGRGLDYYFKPRGFIYPVMMFYPNWRYTGPYSDGRQIHAVSTQINPKYGDRGYPAIGNLEFYKSWLFQLEKAIHKERNGAYMVCKRIGS